MSASQRTPARRARRRRTGYDEWDCLNILAALLGLECLLYTDEISASRTILRRKHADAAAVADFVDVVEQVDDIKPYRHGLVSGHGELMRHPDVCLAIRRHMVEIEVA